jgi:hypothetical protein
MNAPSPNQRRELAHRAGDGIEISLFWSKPENRVTIDLVDIRLDERLEFEVAGRDALDAFYHPYAYAHARVPSARVAAAVRR